MKRYRLKLSLPEEATTVKILGKRVNLARVFPNGLTIIRRIEPEHADQFLQCAFFFQLFGIGAELEEA